MTVTQFVEFYFRNNPAPVDYKLFKDSTIKIGQDIIVDNKKETIHAILMGLVVDYMTRLSFEQDKNDVFFAGIAGRKILDYVVETKELEKKEVGRFVQLINYFERTYKKINNSLNKENIINVAKIALYDAIYRRFYLDIYPENINVDDYTTDVVVQLVERVREVLKNNEGLVCGVRFQEDQTKKLIPFTQVITAGDGDFYDKNTLWDVKVSKKPLTKQHALQLMIYWLLGLNSADSENYKRMKMLGVINPRLNKISRINIRDIPRKNWLELAQQCGYEKTLQERLINEAFSNVTE